MPVDGKPSEEHSFLARPLSIATRLVVRAPKAAIVVALLLAAASVYLGATRLKMHTSRLDLLNPKSDYNQLWLDYIEDFGGEDDAVVVVEGAGREAILPAIEDVAERLKAEKSLFHDILYKVDLAPLRAKQLHYLTPQQLEKIADFAKQVEPIAAAGWSSLRLTQLLAQLGQAGQSPNRQMRTTARQVLALHVENLHRMLVADGSRAAPTTNRPSQSPGGLRPPLALPPTTNHQPPTTQYISPWNMMDFGGAGAGGKNPFQTRYLLTGDDKIGMILLRLTVDESSFDRGTAAIDRLREILAEANLAYPDVRIGLTGLPVMENDEMRSSTDATIKGSVLSLLGVLAIFIVGFGGLRHPMLAAATLVIALCWTLAYIVFTIGHLNILSMSFGLILIGLGIDFGVHYVARYFQERQSTASSAKALVATADAIGPGVVTGGVTTALAFFAAGLTDFTGVAELGVIAGGGVLLCMLGAMFVLPSMIVLSDRHSDTKMESRLLAINRWFGFTRRLPRLTMCAALLITGVCCLGLPNVWYDHNLLHLQPAGLESVKLEQRLLDETDQSVWYAISLADSREELLARKARFEALDSVERTEEIASLLPGDEKHKSAILRRLRKQLAGLPETPPQLPVDDPAETARALVAAHRQLGLSAEGQGEQWMQVVEILRNRPSDAYRVLSDYQQRMVNDLLTRLKGLRAAANPVGPRLEDLPPSLVERFVGDSGRYLIKVYSKADIWDMDALRKFVRDVRSVDSEATGQPLQTYEASRQMKRSYVHAALYALIAVSMVLIIDFRSVRYSLCALVPVGLGMVMMFGLLGLLDIPLNPANMIVLPLILGIGVDNGVHVLHDFRRQPGQYRLSRATATAVVITALTTMAGFGSIMIADHRGLESLGRVLTLGMGCCLFMALVPLPALLAWISRHEPEPEEALAAMEEGSEAELAGATRTGA